MKNILKILLFTTILTLNFSCSANNLKNGVQSPTVSEKRELNKEERKAEKLVKEKDRYSISPESLPENEKLYISLKNGWRKEKEGTNGLEYRVLFRNDKDKNKEQNLLIISNNISSSVSNEELAFLSERIAVEYFTIDKITDFRKGNLNGIEFYSAGGINTKEKNLYGLLFLRRQEQVYLVFCEDKNDLNDCGQILSTLH